MLDFPEDLLEEILCHVPATSLKRLRSTCKRWNSLFSDKRFTKKHFDKAEKQFLVLMLTNEFRICSMSVNLQGTPSIKVTGELSLIDPRSRLDQFKISKVFHCDGLLLCTNKDNTRMVVWNPCTGQTKWIHHYKGGSSYTLGSYQDNNSGNNSYKILNYNCCGHNKFKIYEIDSDSWRVLDVTPDCRLMFINSQVSLKGKTYWFAWEIKEGQLGVFLVSFDYTRERFERMRLPYNCLYDPTSLSVVREEKLSVLLQHTDTSRHEIWVTNKIDETKMVTWSKVLTMDYPERDRSFAISSLVDEEKKVIVCCERCLLFNLNINTKEMVYIAGEDNKVTQVEFGEDTVGSCEPFILNYVPSLVQIQ